MAEEERAAGILQMEALQKAAADSDEDQIMAEAMQEASSGKNAKKGAAKKGKAKVNTKAKAKSKSKAKPSNWKSGSTPRK